MSEVISLSKKKPAKTRKKCSYCECLFSFVKAEAQYIDGHDGDCYKVKCPNCGVYNYIAASLVKP